MSLQEPSRAPLHVAGDLLQSSPGVSPPNHSQQLKNPVNDSIGNSIPPSQSSGILHPPPVNSPVRGLAVQPPLDLSIPALPRPNFDLKRDGCVVSPDQIDNLRRQIAVYSTICQQLVAMFQAMTSPVPGMYFLCCPFSINTISYWGH